MKILELNRIRLYQDIAKENYTEYDATKEMANFIYTNMVGLAYHALALKIWNSGGKIEIDENEEHLLREVVNQYLKPCVIDAIEEQLQQV